MNYIRKNRQTCECGAATGAKRVGNEQVCDRCWTIDSNRNRDERKLSKAFREREEAALRERTAHFSSWVMNGVRLH